MLLNRCIFTNNLVSCINICEQSDQTAMCLSSYAFTQNSEAKVTCCQAENLNIKFWWLKSRYIKFDVILQCLCLNFRAC